MQMQQCGWVVAVLWQITKALKNMALSTLDSDKNVSLFLNPYVVPQLFL